MESILIKMMKAKQKKKLRNYVWQSIAVASIILHVVRSI